MDLTKTKADLENELKAVQTSLNALGFREKTLKAQIRDVDKLMGKLSEIINDGKEVNPNEPREVNYK